MKTAYFPGTLATLVAIGMAASGTVLAATDGGSASPTAVVTTAALDPAAAAQPARAEEPAPALFGFEAGVYKCELGRSVNIKGISTDRRTVNLQWARRDYNMLAVATSSGALRFEDRSSGLVWIVIPAKAMLLDSSKGKQLANECRL